MENIFEMMTGAEEEGSEIIVNVGIHMKVGGHETTCPISGPCNSYKALEIEIQAIKNNLDGILGRAKEIFRQPTTEKVLDLRSDMDFEEIWSILSGIAEEDVFIKSFNGLEEAKRREVAEYVLTKCNVFSGKASVFSSRYDNETGLME